MPPPPAQPRRRHVFNPEQQRRIVYIPVIVNQPVCYYYDPASGTMTNVSMEMASMGQQIGIPSFYFSL